VVHRCVWLRNLVKRGGHSPRWAAEPEKIKKLHFLYSEYVFIASGSNYAKPVCRIILSSVACPVALYFPTLSYQHHDFR
jgi:hypothetical protein